MPGRAIDQLLPHAVRSDVARSRRVSDARTYIRLAEQRNGPIPTPIDYAWPWGESLAIVDQFAPDIRLINLETSITACGEFAPGKAVHYRMHPDNIGLLDRDPAGRLRAGQQPRLDFGYQGLADTLRTLDGAGIRGSVRDWM